MAAVDNLVSSAPCYDFLYAGLAAQSRASARADANDVVSEFVALVVEADSAIASRKFKADRLLAAALIQDEGTFQMPRDCIIAICRSIISRLYS